MRVGVGMRMAFMNRDGGAGLDAWTERPVAFPLWMCVWCVHIWAPILGPTRGCRGSGM